MVGVLVLLVLTLRLGLALRRHRLSGALRSRESIDRHIRWALPAVALLAVGFLAGGASAIWLRGWSPIGTLHGGLGLSVLLVFSVVVWLGRSLRQGRSQAAAVHGALALVGVALAALAALAGFVLLP